MPFTPGFVLAEAQALLTIAGLSEDTVTPPPSSPPPPPPPAPPAGWAMLFQSPPLGPFDNLFQLWQNNNAANQYAVAIRGTIDETGSIIEDLVSLMIPASFQIALDSTTNISFQFAAENTTGVRPSGIHLGFTMGALFLLLDPENLGVNGILAKLLALPHGSEVYITGHSQGAAVASLVTSYLHYPNYLTDVLPSLTYKTYSFAQPKPGNDQYSWDYEQAVVSQGMGIRVTNPLDWVPQVPLTVEFLQDINIPNPISASGLFGSSAAAAAVTAAVLLKEAHALAWASDQFTNLPALIAVRGAPQGLLPGAVPLSIMMSLNFMPAGGEIALKPDPSFSVPSDGFSQHHVATYQALLLATFG